MDAVTCGNLILMLKDTALKVISLAIEEGPNCHGQMVLTAVSEEQMKDFLIYEGGEYVALYAVQDGEQQPIFYGITTWMKAFADGGTCLIQIKAITESCRMDLEPYNRSFQDTAMTFPQLIRKAADGYPGSQIQFSIGEHPMGRIAVQYQETDWAFIKRLLSLCREQVYADSTSRGICLYAGLPEHPEQADWDRCPYVMTRSMAPEDQISFLVETYEILPLCSRIRFHGRELYIGSVSRSLEEGLLVSRYGLYTRKGLENRSFHNPLLSGVSIHGSVTSVRRNQLRVQMETDALAGCADQHYFPFSTVAASPDGSGWYCMPKAGDPVRIFFPAADETEGYAIANVQGESAPAADSPMGNPDLKDITMPDGKKLKFIQGGIQLGVGKDKGTVTLTNDGNAVIMTEEDIAINAAERIYFTCEGIMNVSAGTKIEMICDGGSSISITEDTVEIKACVIESN